MELKEMLEVIKAARRLIDMGWCQWDYAQNSQGNGTSVLSKYACAWCSCGALRASMPRQSTNGCLWDSEFSWSDYEGIRGILDAYIVDNGLAESLVDYNEDDGRTQFDILHVFSQVIKQLEEEISVSNNSA